MDRELAKRSLIYVGLGQAADDLLDAGAGAAATGKEGDHQLGGKRQDELGGKHRCSRNDKPRMSGAGCEE